MSGRKRKNPNQPLVNWASAAVRAYYAAEAKEQGDDPPPPSMPVDHEAVVMLLASLRHLVDAEGWQWGIIESQARATYLGEVDYARAAGYNPRRAS